MIRKKSAKAVFDFDAVFEPDDYLHFYQGSLTEERTKKETAFLIKELELSPSMEILDLACGHGRHANCLAEAGYLVTGMDRSNGFLKIAKKDAAKRNIRITYLHGDMRELSFKNKFDRVLLLFTAFGYFEDNENMKVLKNISRALKPGGLFIFDIHNKDTFVKNLVPYIVAEKGRDLMIERLTFDAATSRSYNRRIVIRNGKRKDKPFFVRLYSFKEIREHLSVAGLTVRKSFGDWDGTPFTSSSKRMLIIAEK